MLTKDKNKAFSCTEVPPLSAKPLSLFSMCAVNAKFVYLTGGCNLELGPVANCDRYDIDRN